MVQQLMSRGSNSGQEGQTAVKRVKQDGQIHGQQESQTHGQQEGQTYGQKECQSDGQEN